MRRAQASADLFYIGKHDSNRLREIWSGGEITAAAFPPAKPPLQATPASLATLEASDDRPLWLSCRDGKVFFDQLMVPKELRAYFGRPSMPITDLLKPPPCESGSDAQLGLSLEELDSFILDGPLTSFAGVLVPVSNTWPMGFGWSSFVAQSMMVSTCRHVGYAEQDFLSEERLLLPDGGSRLAVATDDVNLFTRMSPAERAETRTMPLAHLDLEWERSGLISQTTKAVDLALDAKVLGVELRGGVRLQSRGARLWSLLEAGLDLLAVGAAAPGALAVLNGHLQWQNLLNRPLYSCLHEVYDFIHLLPEHASRPVPARVLSEVMLNVSLFPFWSADLRRPWWPLLPATDASPSYGFGLSIARCDPALTRATAAAAAETSCVIRLAHEPGDAAEIARAGTEFRLPLGMSDFHDVFAVKAEATAHSGAMELQAVVMGLLRITRTARHHSHRGVVLVDAQAVGFALRKGRSSAGTLRRGVCSAAAISLAADLKLSFPYLPSESNPADFPSRGKVRKRSTVKRRRVPIRCSMELLDRAYRKAWRRAASCSNT